MQLPNALIAFLSADAARSLCKFTLAALEFSQPVLTYKAPDLAVITMFYLLLAVPLTTAFLHKWKLSHISMFYYCDVRYRIIEGLGWKGP